MQIRLTLPSLLSSLLLLVVGPVNAQLAQTRQPSACHQQAKTPLEKSYCEILAKGEKQALPSFSDFRKNPENMQRLLLKAPAKRTGVVLPNATQPRVTQHSTQQRMLEKTTASQAQQPLPQPLAHSSTATEPKANHSPPPTNTGLESCTLTAFSIRCANGEYVLQNNKQNHELRIGALDKTNTLTLAARNSRTFSTASDNQYLSAVYRPYIEKMLEIGLADATMSFTKFAATYADHKQQGTNFCNRFYDMYELLKEERKTNGVKTRYTNEYPASIAQCMTVNSTLIVCDNIANNWIYKRQ